MKSNNPFPQPICEQIWNGKYRLITPNPDIPDDMSVEDTWRRISKACASVVPAIHGTAKLPEDMEAFAQTWEERYFRALNDFNFLPAGRITAGAGSGRNVTLFNCYVMGTIPDDMSGIFNMLKEAALTMQQGGGIGYDFSPLRPKNAPVKGVDADASGPLSFMDVWDAMCRTIMSAGARRGAMMATMRCDHPDVFDFATAKHDARRLRMFNVSVLATDVFMDAVLNDDAWALVHDVPPADTSLGQDEDGKWIYKWIQARDLWETMMTSTYNYAEPGVLFVDRINKMNNLWYIERISATNPCGEQPLPPYGACLLGSLNLAKMVTDPFTKQCAIDQTKIETTTRIAVRMLDSVIDTSLFPIPQQKEEALKKRRMGLGVTGLADMLFMLNMKYGSAEAAETASRVMQIITETAYDESIRMAIEFGPCPATDTKEKRIKFVQSGFMVGMPSEYRDRIIQYGIRNALLTSIAPTGTISLYAGNVSSGVEPIFAPSYTRKVLENDGVTRREEVVEDYAVKLYREYRESNGMDVEPNPENLVTAQTLTPKDHLVMQAAVQRWIDSSISKTINCPEDIDYEDFKEVYLEAYRTGCKGCTTYRPNAVTGSVLSVKPEEKSDDVDEGPQPPELDVSMPYPRPEVLDGETYKLKWEGSNIYVTINHHKDPNGVPIPFEIFINSKEMAHFQWTVALTRMISAVFRRGGDVTFVVEELKNVFDPNGGAWMSGKYIPSFIALLGHTLETHMKSIGYIQQDETLISEEVEQVFSPSDVEHVGKPTQCPQCKGFNVVVTSSCPTCRDCGHSKCG